MKSIGGSYIWYGGVGLYVLVPPIFAYVHTYARAQENL